MNKRFHGVITPMVTPLLDRDTLDNNGLERLICHLISGEVHGIFILGSTGEAQGLGYRLRRELIKRTCDLVKGKVPLLVGVTDTAFTETVSLAHYAADHGADGLVVSTPYYFPAGQEELQEYLHHLSKELPLPTMLYNNPKNTKIAFEPTTVQLATQLERYVGVKDSSGDMVYFHQLLHLSTDRKDWVLLIGPEALLAEAVLLGGDGGVPGGSNLFPELYVELYEMSLASNIERMTALHSEIIRLSNTIFHVGRYSSSFIKGLKCALNCLGICNDFMEEPFHRFHPEQRHAIEQYLREMGATVSNPRLSI
jgi:dihydrodipicolinate synthase/N-acetylneuraminate lyase